MGGGLGGFLVDVFDTPTQNGGGGGGGLDANGMTAGADLQKHCLKTFICRYIV
jgi:hypothetical protein